ncbi:unnamed protein product, partial [Rotaria magnacalcarata]
EMTVLRIENGAPYVQLDLGKRNLNAEIRAILPQPAAAAAAAEIVIDNNIFIKLFTMNFYFIL